MVVQKHKERLCYRSHLFQPSTFAADSLFTSTRLLSDSTATVQPEVEGMIHKAFNKLVHVVKHLSRNYCSTSPLNDSSLLVRSKALTLIRCLHLFFGNLPETFMVAANILDKFLSVVKIKEKHVSCVASACYFIAIKVHQEDEELPSATYLAYLHGNRWKPSDLCRMEKVILQKINWDMSKTTCVTFIRLFYEILSQHDIALEKQSRIEGMVCLLEQFVQMETFTSFNPSNVALSVVHHCLQKEPELLTQSIPCLLTIQLICKIHDSEMYECKLALESYITQRSSHKKQFVRSHMFPFVKIRSRPSSEGESELPVISEDRHVNEDGCSAQ